MKNKFVLALLALPAFCLTACGGSNDIFNKTFVYKGVISNIDNQAFANDPQKRTQKQWLTQEFNNIDWGSSTFPHGSVDEVIKAAETSAATDLKREFGDIKIVVGSKESKKATITALGKTGEYSFDPAQELIIDFKDSSGDTCYVYTIAKMVNGVVEEGYFGGSATNPASYSYTFPLKEQRKLTDEEVVDKIYLRYLANVGN